MQYLEMGELGRRGAWGVAVWVMLGAIFPASVQAQEVTGEDLAHGSTSKSILLEEIVVTATRREERLNTVPVSVTAVSSAQVDALGARDISDIQTITPNFNVQAVVTRPNDPILVIRGVLKRDGDATLDTAVGVYSDDVFLARGYSVMGQLLDVERIEVLRGPQGTLFGRNTIGGAVQVISKKPKIGGPIEGYVEGTVGNYDLHKIGGAINVPLGDNIAIRIAGKSEDRSGYTTSYLVDDSGPNGYQVGDPILETIDTNDAHNWSGRISLAWEVTPDTRLDLSAYRSKSNTNGVLSRGIAGDLGGFVPTYIQSSTSCLRGGCGTAVGFSQYAQSSFYKGLTDIRPNGDSDVDIYIGKLEHHFGPVTAKFIGSFADSNSVSALNTDGIVGFGTPLVTKVFPVPAVFGRESAAFSTGDVKQKTFELQFSGAIGSSIDWMLGAYYFEENANDLVYLTNANIGPNGVPVNIVDAHVNNDSKSIYGSFKYGLTDRLSLRVGGRYTKDNKQLIGRSRTLDVATGIGTCAYDSTIKFPTGLAAGSNVDPACSLNNSQGFSNFTWDGSLDYKVNEATFLYAKVATGYRTGGISLNAISAATAMPFKEDRVTSYELGIKTDIGSFGHVNVAGFYMDYKDIQQNVVSSGIAALGIDCLNGYAGPAVVVTCNIGNGVSKGVEIDARIELTREFSILATYGYTKLTYDNKKLTSVFVPENSASVTANYATDIGHLPVNAMLSYDYAGSFRVGTPNGGVPLSVAELKGHNLLNARLAVDLTNQLTASIWARNLTQDKYYSSGATVTASFIQVNSGVPAAPRTLGFDVKYAF